MHADGANQQMLAQSNQVQFMSSQEHLSGMGEMSGAKQIVGNAANRITSTERFQNNNVSSSNPKKAIVTPRQNQLKSFKNSNEPDVMAVIQNP